jgi:hypothetical protein
MQLMRLRTGKQNIMHACMRISHSARMPRTDLPELYLDTLGSGCTPACVRNMQGSGCYAARWRTTNQTLIGSWCRRS